MARSRARYLAPIALAATISATYLVIHKALSVKHAAVPAQVVTHRGLLLSAPRRRPPPVRGKFYVVKPGDSLSVIAANTGISLDALKALNPNVDPNALQPGQHLRLRR